MADLQTIADALNSPVTENDVIGFYKIMSFREHSHGHLLYMVKIAQQYNFNPHQVFLNMLDIPEIARAMNLDVIKEYSFPIPIKMNFGAIVFGFVWDNFISDSARRTGAWEPKIQEIIAANLKPGDVALDIGGNIGCHAALMASIVGQSGAVHTFEPERRNIEALRKMKEVNNFSQLVIHPVAVSAEEGVLNLHVHGTNSGGNSVGSAAESVGGYFVRAITIDKTLLPSLTRLDFIKIDIEGHEGPALEGAVETLARFQPTVVMELSPNTLRSRGTDPVRIVQNFLDAGLQIDIIPYGVISDTAEEIVSFVERTAPFLEILAKRPN